MPRKGGVPANLKNFKKGYDPRRNTKANRPVVTDIKRYIREQLAQPAAKDSDYTRLDAIIARLLQKAYSGDIRAVELALSYGFGKPAGNVLEMRDNYDNIVWRITNGTDLSDPEASS